MLLKKRRTPYAPIPYPLSLSAIRNRRAGSAPSAWQKRSLRRRRISRKIVVSSLWPAVPAGVDDIAVKHQRCIFFEDKGSQGLMGQHDLRKTAPGDIGLQSASDEALVFDIVCGGLYAAERPKPSESSADRIEKNECLAAAPHTGQTNHLSGSVRQCEFPGPASRKHPIDKLQEHIFETITIHKDNLK